MALYMMQPILFMPDHAMIRIPLFVRPNQSLTKGSVLTNYEDRNLYSDEFIDTIAMIHNNEGSGVF
jgi:hypothetical protein